MVISQTLAWLAAPPARLDPLALGGDVVDAVSGVSFYSPRASAGQAWLNALINDPDIPLHRMLWPDSDLERACQPYQVPTEPAQNRGDGHFRGDALAQLENRNAPAPDQQTTLDAVIVANLSAGGSFNNFLTVSGKNLSSALMSIYDTLQGAVNTAVAAVDASREKLAEAASDSKASQARYAKAEDRLTQTKARLGAGARPISVTLHAKGIEQLRSLLPNTFGAAYFMRRSQVTQNYYLFGLEDLPSRESVPKTFYGEFLDHNGRLIGSTDRRRLPDLEVSTAEHLVLAIPRNHSTAQLVGNINRQLTAAQQTATEAAGASGRLMQASSALSDALEQHGTRSNAMAYRILSSRPFSVGVLMLEMWNVAVEMQAREQILREKGHFRTIGGLGGAAIDLIIAMEALTVKLVGTKSALAAARKPLFEINRQRATRWLPSGSDSRTA
ncbi:hypothetical protein [Pseudomonas sp. Pseusp122]|uniref:hypothetical protein n=2 Tax=unclassified Pseudomonas TaxID=196821 RepID=UPI0039B0BA64